MGLGKSGNKLTEHQTGEGEKIKTFEDIRQPFIVSRQSPEAARLNKTPFFYPLPRQEHKLALGL